MPRKVTSSPNAQQIGVQRDHRSTEPKKDYKQGLNKFDNSYIQAFSQRYADIHPFMVMDGLPADDMPFRSIHELGTYTLKSPLKSDVYMHKTIALVPYQSILPNTWKLFYVNPTKGDDIPDDVYCTLDVIKHVREELINVREILLQPNIDDSNSNEVLLYIVGGLLVAESVLSTGSLCSALKMNFHSYVTYKFGNGKQTYDDFFDIFMSSIINSVGLSCTRNYGDNVDKISTKIDMSMHSSVYRQVSPHFILDVLRDSDFSSVNTGVNDDGFIPVSSAMFDLPDDDGVFSSYSWLEFRQILHGYVSELVNLLPENSYPVSVERVIAYQLACMKFMSDDSIDTIYNANLFRNNFSNLFDYGDSFQYNGQPIIYDVFSNHNLEKAFSSNSSAFTLLFRYRQSLKYGDYFNSSRPSPYAVGDVNAPVVNNFVSAIDITKKISDQRFLNWSNRTGMSYEDYVEGLTGVRPTMDISEPLFVAHEMYKISGFEVENTGAAQQESGTNSVTTLLKSTRSDYLYNIGIQDPCIVIGLSHFDVKRLYTRIMDRNNLKSNRFDFFNKFYQYTGDQEIKRVEIDASATLVQNFAYTTRFMQFKQQVSHAGGAFIGSLRSWAMVADADDDVQYLGIINSDFIRNSNSSFDIFFGSVSGLSLGNYFHFSVIYHNDFSEMRRAMDVAPDIL